MRPFWLAIPTDASHRRWGPAEDRALPVEAAFPDLIESARFVVVRALQ